MNESQMVKKQNHFLFLTHKRYQAAFSNAHIKISTPNAKYIRQSLLLWDGAGLYAWDASGYELLERFINLSFNSGLSLSFVSNSYLNKSLFMFHMRLLPAQDLLTKDESFRPPTPWSSLVIKETVAVSIVLTFQPAVHVSLWKFVKLVQIGVLGWNLPLGVQKSNLGGEKGQSSWSQRTPWQNPSLQTPSSPKIQKWKLSKPFRVTMICGMGYSSRLRYYFWRRKMESF